MIFIDAVGVNHAWYRACELVSDNLALNVATSRAGTVRVAKSPVITSYSKPTERVLLDPIRDANPFFHLMEAMWMLAGRNDARLLDQFVHDFSERFAEEDGLQHGAYGHRWRQHFGFDQLKEVISRLRTEPTDRQAVIAMWDPTPTGGNDLNGSFKDRPCNTTAYLRIRNGSIGMETYNPGTKQGYSPLVLDLTVCCRSNDACWGAYGANAVHFSILQEYLAAMIGVGVGTYYQFSNNFHVYENTLNKFNVPSASVNAMRKYPGTQPLVDDTTTFDDEIRLFMRRVGEDELSPDHLYKNSFISDTLYNVMRTNQFRRNNRRKEAIQQANLIAAPDWRTAVIEWLRRRDPSLRTEY